ncbi:MAG: hypothetical protein JKY89_12275 [Immundisolibacteraceae bacterium]|nr:hypothetical protein [Immundisolibacteraceae bacterium]
MKDQKVPMWAFICVLSVIGYQQIQLTNKVDISDFKYKNEQNQKYFDKINNINIKLEGIEVDVGILVERNNAKSR